MSLLADRLIEDLLVAADRFGERAEVASGLPQQDLEAIGYGPDVATSVIAHLRKALGQTAESQVGITDLLKAGVHFGHQTRRWNPKMRRFIHGERSGIYIIDLLKTASLLEQAQQFASEVARRGGTVLFVGTKKQARDAIRSAAETAEMPYINHRWLGGLLTNFQTINQRIRRLRDLEHYEAKGQLDLLPTRERIAAQTDLAKLRANLGGIKNMQSTPDAVFVIDLKTEAIAVREARRLRIPVIGLVDTNCDPDGIDYLIPGNDDAMRSCALIAKAIGDVVGEGRAVFRAQEEKARQEHAEERARREAEEQAKREAEEPTGHEAAPQQTIAAAQTQAPAEQAPTIEQQPAQPTDDPNPPAAAAASAGQPAAPAQRRVGTVRGTVRSWDERRGIGYIEPDGGGPQIVVEREDIAPDTSGRRRLKVGVRVEFDTVNDAHRPRLSRKLPPAPSAMQHPEIK